MTLNAKRTIGDLITNADVLDLEKERTNMPTIQLHIPEADYELIQRASGKSKRAFKAFILTAAEIRARRVIVEKQTASEGTAG